MLCLPAGEALLALRLCYGQFDVVARVVILYKSLYGCVPVYLAVYSRPSSNMSL
jgi:hypothetical protein